MAKRKATPIEGRWNIVSLTAWDVEETVEELQLIIRFERSDAGQFQFGCVYGEMDYSRSASPNPQPSCSPSSLCA
jgi:hypothetical protein